MRSPSIDPATLECALPVVLEAFRERATVDPTLLIVRDDSQSYHYLADNPLLDLGRNTCELFTAIGSEYVNTLGDTPQGLSDALRMSFRKSTLGICATAMFEEAVALVLIQQSKRSPSAARVANVVRRSGGFIDSIATQGADHGEAVLEHYLGTYFSLLGNIVINPVIDYKQAKKGASGITDRLKLFELSEDRRLVTPVGFDEHRAAYFENHSEASQTGVCPARLVFDAQRDLPITEGLYHFMNDFAEEHIYPDFIPAARSVLKTHDLLGHI